MRSLKWIRHALPLLLVFVTGCSQAVQIPAEPADPGDVQAPVPVTEPAPSVPESLDVQVEHFLSGMTQEQKIAQIFFVTPEALKDGSGRVIDADDSVRVPCRRIDSDGRKSARFGPDPCPPVRSAGNQHGCAWVPPLPRRG